MIMHHYFPIFFWVLLGLSMIPSVAAFSTPATKQAISIPSFTLKEDGIENQSPVTSSITSPTTSAITPASDQEVHVVVERTLPAVATPQEARNQWLKLVWEDGGTLLPVIYRCLQEFDIARDLPTKVQRRQVIPLMLEEDLLTVNEDDNSNTKECKVSYKVTGGGLIESEIVPDSHLGVVTFQKDDDNKSGCKMTWNVTWTVTEPSRRWFWQWFTATLVHDISTNFQAALATPQLFTCTRQLRTDLSPTELQENWLQFVWRQGAGGWPPLLENNTSRWIVPPFLHEIITNIESTDQSASIDYRVANPSLVTYQTHSHRGRVRFESVEDDSTSKMIWQVEIRPYPYVFNALVTSFTSLVVASYADNFQVHVQEPHAMVELKPPRGAGKSFGKIRKDSWLGRVLDAHLKDKRSTMEQTLALFQPWTWGQAEENENNNKDGWTKGFLD